MPNPLTLINRWKILDNLRRSLLAPASLAAFDLQLDLQRGALRRQRAWSASFCWCLFSFNYCSGWRSDGEGTFVPCTRPAAI